MPAFHCFWRWPSVTVTHSLLLCLRVHAQPTRGRMSNSVSLSNDSLSSVLQSSAHWNALGQPCASKSCSMLHTFITSTLLSPPVMSRAVDTELHCAAP